ncbi:MAG: carboxypeptidase regulatory-like domain-containing protein [Gammaproteobacteria bacterium]|nr:carboxypeptidase regulatory-like domain-containing protein [Gammaproteobacteria bacterium]
MQGRKRCLFTLVLLVLAMPFAAQSTSEPSADAGPGMPAGGPSSVVLWQPGDPGERLFLRGRVIDSGGRPVPGATVALRQADGTGQYQEVRYRATFQTAKDGTFSISTVLPGQYWGPKHIHMMVRHGDGPPLVTRILFKGDPHLDDARDGDFAILLEEVHKDGEKILVGGVELVIPGTVSN